MSFSGKLCSFKPILVFLALLPVTALADSITIPSLGISTSAYGTTFNGNVGQGASLSSEYTYAFSPEVLWISGKDLDVTYSLQSEVKRMNFNPLTYGTLSQNDATLFRGGFTNGRKLGTFWMAFGASFGNELLFSTSGPYSTRAQVETTWVPEAKIQISKDLLFYRAKELDLRLDGGYLIGSNYRGFGLDFGFDFAFLSAVKYSFFGTYSLHRVSTAAGKQSVSEVILGLRFAFLGEEVNHLYLEGMDFL